MTHLPLAIAATAIGIATGVLLAKVFRKHCSP